MLDGEFKKLRHHMEIYLKNNYIPYTKEWLEAERAMMVGMVCWQTAKGESPDGWLTINLLAQRFVTYIAKRTDPFKGGKLPEED